MRTLLLSLLISTSIADINFISPLQKVSADINNSIIFNQKRGYNEEYTTIFNNMMKSMNTAPNTGNVNLDFVLEMVPHHESGISMTRAVVKYGSNPEVKKVAENIITSQEAQIPIMKQLKARFGKEKPSSRTDSEEYLEEYNKVKGKVFKKMQGVEITSNIDANFLQEMIYHHEGAIGMTKDILRYTKDPELRKLAGNIVTTQSKGVEEMKALLKEL